MPITIVLINGPPRSGKDTLAAGLARRMFFKPMKFATPLKAGVSAIFGLDERTWAAMETGDAKEAADPRLMGMSPRGSQIWLSEDVLKKEFGEQIFGTLLRDRITARGADRVVVSDSGFEEEAMVLVRAFGAENIRLIRLHRPDHSFAGDSRNYIELPGVPSTDLHNNSSTEALEARATSWLGAVWARFTTAA